MKLIEKNKEVEIADKDWPLADSLFTKWGYSLEPGNDLEVWNLDLIVSELSAWGVPWKRTKWNW